MREARLVFSPAVFVAPGHDGYLAFDAANDRLHHLNPSAALIVELCDGSRDRADLLALLVPLLGAGSTSAIEAWLDDARSQGLLVEAGSRRVGLSVRALGRLVTALRDEGRVLPAFLCQRKVAERRPADPDAWLLLGELAHILGRRQDARSAFETALRLRPEDAEIRHILHALRDEAPPARAPDECISQLYARFASFYDASMCDDLEYRAPEILHAAIARDWGGRHELTVLDLGCGTGLSGQRLRGLATRLIGVDLSSEMIEQARKRGVYDVLEVAEITAWLAQDGAGSTAERTRFDLVAACDCLIYFGDLRQVIGPARRRLAPGGRIALTVERGETFPYRLTDSGRYAHHPDHIVQVAAECRLNTLHLEEAVLRVEYGEPVVGLVAVLEIQDGSPA